MTAFEIITIVLLAIIAAAVVYFCSRIAALIKVGFAYAVSKIEGCDSKLGYIKGVAQDISQQLDNIEDNILDDLRDICIAQELGKTSPNTPLPCYAPDGICSNPFGDCINCPKRGTGGTWSTNTSIKAEGEMFQEKFNDSKED